MYKILIIEDEVKISSLIKSYFDREGHETIIATNGVDGIELFKTENPHLIILDVMMPSLNGYETCTLIRKNSNVPIIFLTAKSEDKDKLLGFDLGADDYITKPFSPKVLVAKVNALLLREYSSLDNKKIHKTYDIEINEISHKVTLKGKELSLTPTEYDLLLFLYSNKNIALTRDQILNGVWGDNYFGDTRTVDTNIKRLREKLQDNASLITTIRGSGYRFEDLKS